MFPSPSEPGLRVKAYPVRRRYVDEFGNPVTRPWSGDFHDIYAVLPALGVELLVGSEPIHPAQELRLVSRQP